MRIGIDAYNLSKIRPAGIGHYTDYLVRHLLAIDQTNEYFLFNLVRDPGLRYSNLHLLLPAVPGIPHKLRVLAKLVFGDQAITRAKIDLFWGTWGFLPLRLPQSVRTIVTVHDLTVYLHPETMAFDNYLLNRSLLKRSLARADKIIAVSDATADAVRHILKKGASKDKVITIHHGVDTARFQFHDRSVCVTYLAKHFAIDGPYILFVGTREPRKNITCLLKAFKILREQHATERTLVVIGGEGWKQRRLHQEAASLGLRAGEISFPGYVDDRALAMFYGAADVFVMPSFYEGFGLPLIEAAACGAPVVASDIPVFHEVLGDAALFADPQRPETFADAIQKVITNASLAEDLKHKGLMQSKRFSWQKAAETMAHIMTDMAGTRREACARSGKGA